MRVGNTILQAAEHRRKIVCVILAIDARYSNSSFRRRGRRRRRFVC